MTHSIIIETANDADFALIKGLAQRLGLHTTEKHTETANSIPDKETVFQNLFGSWAGPESGDELVHLIYSSRDDTPRETEL